MSFLDFPGLQYFYNKYLKPIKPHAREETIKSYTVNEQGHVPDAQLVVQLKEENESLQEEIEKLNSALTINAYSRPFLSNAWLIDLANPHGENNKPYMVGEQTQNIPDNLAWGIREVLYLSGEQVILRITGVELDGSYTSIWTCVYNFGSWSGWIKH